MFPIDLLKTRMQVIGPNTSSSVATAYSGISQAIISIGKTEGLRNLWRGVGSVVIGAGEPSRPVVQGRARARARAGAHRNQKGPAHAVYFATYEGVKHRLMGQGDKNAHHPLIWAAAGASATIASDALMNPFDGEHNIIACG